jgi:hypothetical protein
MPSSPIKGFEGIYSDEPYIDAYEDGAENGRNSNQHEFFTGYLYHGTKLGNFFERFDAELSGRGVGANCFDQGDQFYLTKNLKAAEWFGAMAEQKRALMDESTTLDDLGKIPKLTGSVIVFDVAAARIKHIEKMPRNFEETNGMNAADIISLAKSEGYDAIAFPDRGFDTIEGDLFVANLLVESGLPVTFIVINPDKFIARELITNEGSLQSRAIGERNALLDFDLNSINLNSVTVADKQLIKQSR